MEKIQLNSEAWKICVEPLATYINAKSGKLLTI